MKIKKTWLFITGILLSFNIYVSYVTQAGKTFDSFFYQLLNLTFPLWASFIAGSLLGYVIAFLLRGNETFAEKLVKAKLIGFMIVNGVFSFFYIYLLYYTYSGV